MLRVFRNPTYAKLFSAQVIALLGTGLLTVALGLLAFDIAGDAAGSVLGTALTIKMVAYVGVAPLIAAVVDRLPKKAVLVTADLIRLAIAVMLPFVTEAWQIYVLVFVLQSASATFTPAFQSLIPSVLPEPEDYTRALSLSRLAYDLEALLSPTIAAALLTLISYNNLFVGTAVAFAYSAILVLLSRLPARTDDGPVLPFWQRLPLGAKVFARTPTLRFLMLTNIVVAAGTAIVLVNSVVYARGVFGLGDQSLALALACYGMGSLVVALNIPWLVDKLGVIRTMITGAVVITAGLAVAVIVTAVATSTGAGWYVLLGTWVLLGIGTSLVNTPSSRLLADASTTANRNLVYTAQFALSHACFLVTYPIAGWLGAANLTGAAIALLILAAVVGAIAVAFARSRLLRADTDMPTVTSQLGR
ncbi:MFS transporter [Nesterenkonia alkaliphila]|uniref:MFS transporter n=1 Tax=Nesterenkonia alkaliphila TaxID=1463631 RepID=A0A7K1UEK1_9MICC|nr:MFS transporter [Nesterenkonia alkaliphila]MVT24888.1 MFS transporter [Nesterenkonia alkaliphila]GFZ92536.1 MFS transporter [Nesterenkonia alkaliphila]